MFIANMFIAILFPLFFITINANIKEVKNYLRTYGYLNDNGGDNKEITLRNALLLLQETYKLHPIDGTINEATLNFVRRKRCGVPDSPTKYKLHYEKWKKRELGWYFHRATSEVNHLTEMAFAAWANHTNLRFVRDVRNPDIIISFQNYNHTLEIDHEHVCSIPMDGEGVQLAHANLPGIFDEVLEIHIDASEEWDYEETITKKSNDVTVNLLSVLMHEIGHTLGLTHSDDENAIMYSIYNPQVIIEKGGRVSLTTDDILGIQNLYGSRIEEEATTTSATTSSPTKPSPPIVPTDEKGRKVDLCALSSVDAMLIVGRRMYIFYKKWVWPMNVDSKNYDSPQLIANWLRFLPRNFTRIQTIYQRPSGDVVLVAGNMIYQFSIPNLELREQWPKPVNAMWTGSENYRKVSSVVNTYTGRTYIFYNDNYYGLIDECYLRPVDYGLISEDFLGVPAKFNSVFRYKNGLLYFFHKKNYYEYDEFANKLVRAGKFDLNLFNIECAKVNILEQLKNLLSRLSNIATSVNESDGDDDDAQ